uniref:Uncharacterized protein n=1 Tax=Plectus sambesii TaxID=2011161 RepID=A0A914VHA7_9BILA
MSGSWRGGVDRWCQPARQCGSAGADGGGVCDRRPSLLVNHMRPGGGWRRFRRPPSRYALPNSPSRSNSVKTDLGRPYMLLVRRLDQRHRQSSVRLCAVAFRRRGHNESCHPISVATDFTPVRRRDGSPRNPAPITVGARSQSVAPAILSFAAMNLPRHSLLSLLFLFLVAVAVQARPQHKRAVDYFENSPYAQDEGIAIDFVTIAPTSATAEPRNAGGDVRTNRINSFMSTLSQLNDSSGVVQWLRSVW